MVASREEFRPFVTTNPKGVRRSFKVSTKGTLLGGGTQSLPDNWWYKGQRGQGQCRVVPARCHSISGRRLPCKMVDEEDCCREDSGR